MNLRDLAYLVAVDEHRHFGQAAAACHVSQPTLSAQIKKLEQHCGAALFERNNRHVVPTAIGEKVLGHARRLLEEAEAIAEIAEQYADPLSGELRLGVIPTLGPYLLPLIYPHLSQNCPQMSLLMTEDLTQRLLVNLKNHEHDAVLIADDPNDPDLVATLLFDEPFWLAYPRGHVFSKEDEVTLSDLQNTNLMLLTEGHCLRDQALALCHRPEISKQSTPGEGVETIRAASLETLIHMVGAGLGVTLVPALALRGGWTTDMGILTQSLRLPGAARSVYLVTRKQFPRRAAITAIAACIMVSLPNTVVAQHRI